MAATDSDAPVRQSTLAALRDANFARYCAAYIPSMSGTWIRITAMGYLVYDLTGDKAKLGMISLVTSLPQVLLGPVSASFIDRVNRRNVLIASQFLTVLVMLTTAWMIGAGEATYTRLLLVSAILGSLLTFDAPVRIALISSLVDRSLLQNAIAINSSMFNIARVIGPTLAGWFIALVGITWAFGFTALMMIPFPLVLLSIPRLRHLSAPTPGNAGSAIDQLRGGVQYIQRTPQIAALMVMSVIPNVLGMNYVTMAPAYVEEALGREAAMLGYVLAVNGVGAFIGTFSIAHFQHMRNRGIRIFFALTAFGVLTILLGLTSSLWIALLAMLLLGVSWGFVVALNDTLIQLTVEEAFRGRVMSVYAMILSVGPASALLVGWIANIIGIQWALAMIGVLILLYIPFLWSRTALRTID